MQAGRIAKWTWIVPLVAWLVLAASVVVPAGWVAYALAAVALIGVVIAAVHHAEVVAHRIGEPFGTLVLAVAVTVIEVALIVSVMLSGGADKEALARDTVFAAIMICCNGIVGLCLLVGRPAPSRAGFPGAGSKLGAGGALCDVGADHGPAELRDHRAGPGLDQLAAHFRRRHFAAAVSRVRIRADHQPSRLFPGEQSGRK